MKTFCEVAFKWPGNLEKPRQYGGERGIRILSRAYQVRTRHSLSPRQSRLPKIAPFLVVSKWPEILGVSCG
jgi:hypothetical protein